MLWMKKYIKSTSCAIDSRSPKKLKNTQKNHLILWEFLIIMVGTQPFWA